MLVMVCEKASGDFAEPSDVVVVVVDRIERCVLDELGQVELHAFVLVDGSSHSLKGAASWSSMSERSISSAESCSWCGGRWCRWRRGVQ